jgi:hypothetical protein
MKKFLLLGLVVLSSQAQVVDDELQGQIATTAAAIAPYNMPSVAVTAGSPAIVTGVPHAVGAYPMQQASAYPAPYTRPLTMEEMQRLEMQQINYELSQFYAVHAHQGGTISHKDWHDFANGLVARHPDMLELRCDRPSGTGRTYLRFKNPYYLNLSAVSPWCRVYIKSHVVAPITPYW